MPTEGLRRMAMFHGGEGPTLKKLKGVIDLLVFDSSSITEELMAERLKAATRTDVIDIFKRPPMDIWRENLASLNHKTLLVWGRDDRVVPLDSSFILLKTMPNAQLHIYPKVRALGAMGKGRRVQRAGRRLPGSAMSEKFCRKTGWRHGC